MADRRSSDAQIRASMRYNATHTRVVRLALNTKTDADIIAYLETLSNMQGHIKTLLRAEMARASEQRA